MNRTVRNVVVVLFGAICSFLTLAVLLLMEARSGQPTFSLMLFQYVPAGALGAGIAAGLGYYLGARLLRTRPARAHIFAIFGVAAAVVLLNQASELQMMMQGPASATSPAAVAHLMTTAAVKLPSEWGLSGGSSSSDDSSSASASATPGEAPHVSGDTGGTSADGISGGVQGMVNSTSTAGSMGAGGLQRFSQISQGISDLHGGVQSHSARILQLAIFIPGFAAGSLLFFWLLRRVSYCDTCDVFLSSKGEQTRYFDSEYAFRGACDNFLNKARGRQMRQSLEDISEAGSGEKNRSTMYTSTVHISRCAACEKHRLTFSVHRKEGGGWKPISLMGYTADSFDPIDIVRA